MAYFGVRGSVQLLSADLQELENTEATRRHEKQDTYVLIVWMHPIQASSIWPRLICSAPSLKDKPSAWTSGKCLLDKGGLSKDRYQRSDTSRSLSGQVSCIAFGVGRATEGDVKCVKRFQRQRFLLQGYAVVRLPGAYHLDADRAKSSPRHGPLMSVFWKA
jgi:hypothetical protein